MAKKDIFSDLISQLRKGISKEESEKKETSEEQASADPTMNIRLGACFLLYFLIVLIMAVSAKESIGIVVIGFSASLLSLVIFTIIMLRTERRTLEHLIITVIATSVIFFIGLREAVQTMDIPQLTVLNLLLSFIFVLILLVQFPKSEEEKEDEDEEAAVGEESPRENVDFTSDFYYAPTHDMEHQHVQYHHHRKVKRKPGKRISKHPHIEELREERSISHKDIEELRNASYDEELEEVILPSGNYYAKIGGTKYHEPGCMIGEKISEDDRMWFATKEEAERQNLRPCRICVP